MTRKNFISRLIAVMLILSAILSTASASALEATAAGSSEDLQTIYITWQPPIPPSEKGDKLTISVGVLLNGKTYASQDVFDVLGIPKSPECEGTILTVDGFTDVYYPLRESAEQFGYSVLWVPKNEQGGKVLNYWVYVAQKDAGSTWVQVVDHEVPEDNYKYYDYYYVYSDDTRYWWSPSEGDTKFISKENATIVE